MEVLVGLLALSGIYVLCVAFRAVGNCVSNFIDTLLVIFLKSGRGVKNKKKSVCPFCKNEITPYHSKSTEAWAIRCHTKGCYMNGIIPHYFNSKESAVASWTGKELKECQKRKRKS